MNLESRRPPGAAEAGEANERNWLQIALSLPWIGMPVTLALVLLPMIVLMIVQILYTAGTTDGIYTYSLESDPDAGKKTTAALIVLFAWVMLLESRFKVCLALPVPFVSISYKWLILILLAADLGLCSRSSTG